jgi:broad specificity phosphatase PhoE
MVVGGLPTTRRLYVLATAATRAQRAGRFSTDDPIETVEPARRDAVRAGLPTRARLVRGPDRPCEDTAAVLDVSAPPVSALRPWSLGAWAGHAITDVARRESAELAAWRTDPDFAPEGGESLRSLLTRAGTWLAEAADGDSSTLAIAQPEVVRAVVVAAIDAGPAVFWRIDVRPLSMTVLTHSVDGWRLRSLGNEPV